MKHRPDCRIVEAGMVHLPQDINQQQLGPHQKTSQRRTKFRKPMMNLIPPIHPPVFFALGLIFSSWVYLVVVFDGIREEGTGWCIAIGSVGQSLLAKFECSLTICCGCPDFC